MEESLRDQIQRELRENEFSEEFVEGMINWINDKKNIKNIKKYSKEGINYVIKYIKKRLNIDAKYLKNIKIKISDKIGKHATAGRDEIVLSTDFIYRVHKHIGVPYSVIAMQQAAHEILHMFLKEIIKTLELRSEEESFVEYFSLEALKRDKKLADYLKKIEKWRDEEFDKLNFIRDNEEFFKDSLSNLIGMYEQKIEKNPKKTKLYGDIINLINARKHYFFEPFEKYVSYSSEGKKIWKEKDKEIKNPKKLLKEIEGVLA